jgi:S1-C subfamily serine protease
MSIENPRRSSSALRAAGLLLAVLWLVGTLAILAWWLVPWHNGTGLNSQTQPRPVTARGELSALERTNISIYEVAGPSVVHVTNFASAGSGLFDLNERQTKKGTGSGFIWDKEGHIVTNYHVVQGGDAAQVTLADHSTYQSRRIWVDVDQDIAVLWIDARESRLHPIQVGTSHDLKVGQSTYAIGNPFGLDQTMTAGIVSALDREIEAASGRPIRGVIQTSAAINPGNSGGPLLDSAGRLIGMNTAILSPSGAFAGIGFAVPVDEINRIVPQLIQHGRVVRPRLGVQVAADQLSQQLGISDGALVLKVIPGSPAAEAGLRGTRRDDSGRIQLGDVVVALGDHSVKNLGDLYAALDLFKAGQTIAVAFIREGKRQEVQVTLQAREE